MNAIWRMHWGILEVGGPVFLRDSRRVLRMNIVNFVIPIRQVWLCGDIGVRIKPWRRCIRCKWHRMDLLTLVRVGRLTRIRVRYK